jgi:rubrerythrin
MEAAMEKTCVHSCRGLCNALEVAELREREAIREYRKFAESCDYPDVRQLLIQLIAQREKALDLLRETRDILTTKFDTLDNINDSYA